MKEGANTFNDSDLGKPGETLGRLQGQGGGAGGRGRGIRSETGSHLWVLAAPLCLPVLSRFAPLSLSLLTRPHSQHSLPSCSRFLYKRWKKCPVGRNACFRSWPWQVFTPEEMGGVSVPLYRESGQAKYYRARARALSLLPSCPSSSLPKFLRAPLTEAPVSPSSFGYDHLCAHFVEFQPQFSFMEKHLDPFHALEEGDKSHMDKPGLGGPSLPKLPPNTETSPPSHWSLWAQKLEPVPSPLQSCLSCEAPAATAPESPYMLHSGEVT